MVFDRRFNAASPRYLGSASNAQQQKRRAPPGALGLLRPLDPVLLNVLGGVAGRWRASG